MKTFSLISQNLLHKKKKKKSSMKPEKNWAAFTEQLFTKTSEKIETHSS